MYSPNQIKRGLANPTLIRSELSRHYNKIQSKIPHKVGIQGSYQSKNIGDRALGSVFKRELKIRGHHCKIFPSYISDSNSKFNILGGGGVLHDYYAGNLESRLEYISDGGLIIGVGVPGFQSDDAKELASKILPTATLITVRDKESKRRIKDVCDVPVTVTADPAFVYDKPKSEEKDMKYQTEINFRPWFQLSSLESDTLSYYFDYPKNLNISSAKEKYIHNAQKIVEEVEDPVFIPFHKTDENFARENLEIDVLSYTSSIKRTLNRVNSVDKMVATRFHSLIFATICRKPVYAISYAPKVRDLANRMDIRHSRPQNNPNLEFSYGQNIEQIEAEAERNFSLIEEKIGVE